MQVDIGIITILDDSELQALLDAFRIPRDAFTLVGAERYWFFEIKSTRPSISLSVALTWVGRAGNYDASAVTTQMIQVAKPSFLLLVGIAAGSQRAHLRLGDVVVSKGIYGYEPGRLEPEGIAPRPLPRPVNDRVVRSAKFYDGTIRDRWYSEFHRLYRALPSQLAPREKYSGNPASYFATIASGEKLFADGSLEDLRDRYDEAIKAGDMESIGFALAADRLEVPWLVIRGISDHGEPTTKDGRDKDRYHHLASISAASYAAAVLREAFHPQEWLLGAPGKSRCRLEESGFESLSESDPLYPKAPTLEQRAEANRLHLPLAIRDLTSGIKLALIPGGTYVMGATDPENDRERREQPQHDVTVNPFYLGLTPVTQGQWLSMMGNRLITFNRLLKSRPRQLSEDADRRFGAES